MLGSMPLRPILDVASDLELSGDAVIPWGPHAAKIPMRVVGEPKPRGKLVLVSAVTPTKHGEGKSTVSVGLTMGLTRIGQKAVACLREPSLGPVFGIKGGGTGGGKAQVVPANRINLHFTGDMHAITTAHDLCSALVENDLHFGAESGLDPRRVSWPRVLDVNDRTLRQVTTGLGGRGNGVPREARFDITAASEVMAVFAMARDRADLRARLGRIVVGLGGGRKPVTTEDVGAADPMAVLLDEAIDPNLVQTAEGGPALLHGGPFANIAHGCSSVISTRLGLSRADVVVTEAGFGFDLGGEKFLHLKCRSAGLWPSAVVLVVTAKALASHGSGEAGDVEAVVRGLGHLDAQLDNVRAFGLSPVVALNVFPGDSEEALSAIEKRAEERGARAARFTGFADGGAGAEDLAREVVAALDGPASEPRFLYEEGASAIEKVATVAQQLYGAERVVWTKEAKSRLKRLEKNGFGHLPPCIAKTQTSFSDDPRRPALKGGFAITVTDVRVSAGAGFLVILMGAMNTMPGLPREPAALEIRLEADGRVRGLMQGE
jgi:formate--tetrahydrofolate ligase